MRKVMARLVTIEQAARMAEVEPALLIERLNQVLGEGARMAMEASPAPRPAEPGESDATEDHEPPGAPGARRGNGGKMNTKIDTPKSAAEGGIPVHLAVIPAELIVDLDVRPDLRRGEEPFSKIMAARREVPSGGVLRLRATFEPVPLYAVLGKQGLEHWTEKFADDDWRVWFYAPASGEAAEAVEGAEAHTGAASAGETESDPEDDVVILDVRGLEPPEPMVRTFEALEALPVGKTLLQLNVRVPQFLLPQLEGRGFTYEIREQSKDLVRIFIRHAVGGERHPAEALPD
jgi:uncharacterized protein (DUF2249 family)